MASLERDITERARELLEGSPTLDELMEMDTQMRQELDRLHYKNRQLEQKKSMLLISFIQKAIIFVILFSLWMLTYPGLMNFHGLEKFGRQMGGLTFLTLVVPMFFVTLKDLSKYIRSLDFRWAREHAQIEKEFSLPVEREKIYRHMSEISALQDEVKQEIQRQKKEQGLDEKLPGPKRQEWELPDLELPEPETMGENSVEPEQIGDIQDV